MKDISLLKPKEVEKILLKNGFYIKRQTGSHRIYHNNELNAIVVVPFHSKDIPKGTLGNIIKQSKLYYKHFKKSR
ncbi:type II toxin-antitoxin system HicA family toxin [Patescibacteria group bacterium]|nr:type II toxin-antitoxin system HicA family toxin [Patescibacteria group bacterium]